MSSLSPIANLTALRAFSVGQNVTAHNIANVSTDGFVPHVAHYQSGPNADQGVRAVVDTPPSVQRDYAAEAAGAAAPLEPSRTDLAREMTNLIINQRSFQANVVPIRTYDEMLGNLLDIKV